MFNNKPKKRWQDEFKDFNWKIDWPFIFVAIALIAIALAFITLPFFLIYYFFFR